MRNASKYVSFPVAYGTTRRAMCCILMLSIATGLLQDNAVWAQTSASITVPRGGFQSSKISHIQNSVTAAQHRTESILSHSVSAFDVKTGVDLEAKTVLNSLGVAVFIDVELEGYFDERTDLNLKAGASMQRSLGQALLQQDTSYVVNSDGSITIMSIDSEGEPEHLQGIVYNITPLANSKSKVYELANLIELTIFSDSWENNGSGNGTIAIYQRNDQILLSINQSYRCQLAIRDKLNELLQLGGPTFERTASPLASKSSPPTSLSPSDVIQFPSKQSTPALKRRRGFALPGSGTSGGFGGGGALQGGIF